MVNNRVNFGVLICCLMLQTACLNSNIKHDSDPIKLSDLSSSPAFCEDDPLDFYNAMPVQGDVQTDSKVGNTRLDESLSRDCQKLRHAIQLCMPGSKKQNDEKALSILNELTQNSSLAGRDLKFSILLLQHVSQRQQLRKKITLQENRRIKYEQKNSTLKSQLNILQSQLDQLKNIEIEIDKKERSVISPIGE